MILEGPFTIEGCCLGHSRFPGERNITFLRVCSNKDFYIYNQPVFLVTLNLLAKLALVANFWEEKLYLSNYILIIGGL